MSYITVAALAAMLVMALMTTIALTARAEAQVQHAQAEGLVEFMLTDLRDRLHALGRLDALGAVNARALQYHGDDELDVRVLHHRDGHPAKGRGEPRAHIGAGTNTGPR